MYQGGHWIEESDAEMKVQPAKPARSEQHPRGKAAVKRSPKKRAPS
jgi:hypothetical protein